MLRSSFMVRSLSLICERLMEEAVTKMVHQDYIRAGNTAATHETLYMLSLSEIPAVRRRVAENPNTPIEILEGLCEDVHSDVRIAVGLNKRTPIIIVKKLLRDPDADVRYALAETSYLPEDLLNLLSLDDNCYVAQRAMRTLRHSALLFFHTENLERAFVAQR